MMQAPVITAALLVSPVLMACLMLCLLTVLLMLILRECRRKRGDVRTRSHQRYRATAARVLGRLKTLPGDAHRLTYLRKINPYVFEELLLLALTQQG
ncbi:restriction endonuclease, partial [Escherichia coli]|nr:restriction endonuclease [Escherichia coli]